MEMEMQREWLNVNYEYNRFCNDFENGEWEELHLPTISYIGDGDGDHHNNNSYLISSIYPFPFSSSSTTAATITSPGGLGFIQHPVSRLDTLPGVAIKYGVEVTDIKKMNGLVTDLQMFALKSLQIPLPGRHPPSPCLLYSYDSSRQSSSQQTSPCSDFINSFQPSNLESSQRKVSPAMSSLQGYYGLKSIRDPKISQDSDKDVYRKGFSHHMEYVEYLTAFPASNSPLRHHRKSMSFINSFLDENNGLPDNRLTSESDFEKRNEKVVKWRPSQPEMLMREDSNGGVSSAITGKSLALRSKAASRTIDAETCGFGAVPVDSLEVGRYTSVRKSSSTSNLHDQGSSISSIWATSKWSLKQDLQSLSVAAIGRPIFDGLSKPVTLRRHKAALD